MDTVELGTAISALQLDPVLSPMSTVAASSAVASSIQPPKENKKKTIIILRGLPGAGKSRRAREIFIEARRTGQTCKIHSTDEFFTVNGDYRFDVSKLQANHDKNYAAFRDSVTNEVEIIIIDNTNLKKSDYSRYIADGYTVEEIVVGDFEETSARLYARRCSHRVPLTAILKMSQNFEK